jgi:hypothetical protein
MKAFDWLLAVGALLVSVAGAASAAAPAVPAEAKYPTAIHGTWFVRDAAGRAACRQLLRHRTDDKLQDASVISAARWVDWSEGESSQATPVSIRRIAPGRWRFVEHFHLNDDDEFVVANTSVKLLRPGVINETYEYRDSGATKTATRSLFRCR